MVGFAQRKKPRFKTAGLGKRVVVVFGPPASGVSTLVECLASASETPNTVIPYIGRDSLRQAEEALNHVEVVFLDVDGGIFGVDDVQALVDSGLLYTGGGALVRIYADDENINARAKGKEEGYVSFGDLRQWSHDLGPVEERIRTHSLNYFMIPNFELEEAVKLLALRSGLSR